MIELYHETTGLAAQIVLAGFAQGGQGVRLNREVLFRICVSAVVAPRNAPREPLDEGG